MIKNQKVNSNRTLERIYSLLKWFFSINGAVITLLLLIIAAVSAFIIQDTVQRQRYLELLELETRMNFASAGDVIKTYNKEGKILIKQPYNTEVYTAGLQSGYILTLDPKTQGNLYVLYTVIFPNMNEMDSHAFNIMNDYTDNWEKCLINNSSINGGKDHCIQETLSRELVEKEYGQYISNDAVQVQQDINKLTLEFNPTQERLHSFLLKFLIGTKSLKIQQ